MSVILLDGMGVLYEEGNVIDGHLVPYIRARGSGLPRAEVAEIYWSCTAGGLTTGELWQKLGVTGDDADYCEARRLRPGITEALSRLRQAGHRLACLSNDAAAWADLTRARFGLDRWIEAWFISSDIGARKPAREPYLHAMRSLDVPAGEILFVDDREANLATASEIGMRTLLFQGTVEVLGG